MAWRGAVGGAGVVEVGQDVLAAADQGLCECRGLLEPVWDGLFQESMSCCIRYFPGPGSLVR